MSCLCVHLCACVHFECQSNPFHSPRTEIAGGRRRARRRRGRRRWWGKENKKKWEELGKDDVGMRRRKQNINKSDSFLLVRSRRNG